MRLSGLVQIVRVLFILLDPIRVLFMFGSGSNIFSLYKTYFGYKFILGSIKQLPSWLTMYVNVNSTESNKDVEDAYRTFVYEKQK